VRRYAALGSLLVLAACAQTRPSIPRGYTFPDAATGVAIVRVERYDGGNKPMTRVWNDFLQNRLGPMLWMTAGGGPWYEVEPADDGPASDYYAALPAGEYRLQCNTEAGQICIIQVEPGTVVYAGMLRVNGKQTTPYDEYAAAAERFRARNPELAGTLRKSLFRIFSSRPGGLVTPSAPYLEEQPWQGPAHRIPP
jgi:hypothetical protein